jgi:hypothetical protein
MKTTIDIPEGDLEEAMRHSGATTRREAVVMAIQEFNRRRRLSHLAGELGTFDDFLTREEMDALRAEG